MPAWLTPEEDGCLLDLRIAPRSSVTRVDGEYGQRVKIRLTAPPVDGKANQALLKFLGKILGIPPTHLILIRGETGRDKTVRIPCPAGVVAERIQSHF